MGTSTAWTFETLVRGEDHASEVLDALRYYADDWVTTDQVAYRAHLPDAITRFTLDMLERSGLAVHWRGCWQACDA